MFQWFEACEKLLGIKEDVTITPILTLPEGTQLFAVYCDASRVGLGCVFMHNGESYSLCLEIVEYSLEELPNP